MPDVVIQKLNDVYLKIASNDPALYYELNDQFSFMVEGYQFHPAYKNKYWNGKIHLFNVANGQTYVGLYHKIVEYLKTTPYSFVSDVQFADNQIGDKDIFNFIDSLKLSKQDKNGDIISITPHDYQIKAFAECIRKERALTVSPTGSGKSIIIYMAIRWIQQRIDPNQRILLIVPTQGLVEQLYHNFKEYSLQSDWNVEDNCQKYYESQTKQIFISTWQSLHTKNKEYFDSFYSVIVDEAHTAQANSIRKIMHHCISCPFRLGFTGTLQDTKTHQYLLEGLFGSIVQTSTSNDLIKSKHLSETKIHTLLLNYSSQHAKEVKNLSYDEEMKWLFQHPARNNILTNLAVNTQGNTLILINNRQIHGKILEEMLKKACDKTNRPFFYVHGNVIADEREQIRHFVSQNNNCIILATYGTFQLGINIPNLNNIIFASPSKSIIRVLQSIGRVMRVEENKTNAKVFDLMDNLIYKKHVNYTFKHGVKRLEIYQREKFPIQRTDLTVDKYN